MKILPLHLLKTLRMKKFFLIKTFSLGLVLLLVVPSLSAGPAAVAMPDRYSAAAAEKILLEGGNAVDAAITAVFVLAVTSPEAGNIGGGGFMLSFMDAEAAFLDFRERAPNKAERDMYLDEGGHVFQSASLIGGKASGVPGTVKGMQAAHQRYGSLPWKHLLQPAIILARDGFTVPPILAEYAQDKVEEVDDTTNFARYFGHMQAGKKFKQTELAATLRRISLDPDSFYTGITGRQVAAQMAKSGGLITMEDLAAYNALWRAPLQAKWRGYTVLTAPPPSSGGVALIQLLTMHDFANKYFRGVWHNSAQYVHLLAEIEKRVFADRAEYLGDPDYVEVPLAKLLDIEYLARRAGEINPRAISPVATVAPGLESTDTTHLSVMDRHGNAVSLSYTLNWEFGSGVVVEGAGFLLNNEMDDFSAKPGVKNKFGLVGNERNAIEPGKRMLSSMTPTILLKNEKAALVIGTPGGSTIFTSIFQVILNLYDYDMPLQAAVDVTRFHHQLPDAFLLRHDPREISADTRRSLEALGYTVEANSWGDLGDIQAIRSDGQHAEAATDDRGRGEARLIQP
jgi:gamma-glutamyltranspeptidase/glutathione hydrolase